MKKKKLDIIEYPKFDVRKYRKECVDLGFDASDLPISFTGNERIDKSSHETLRDVALINESKNVYIHFFNKCDDSFVKKIIGFFKNFLS